MREQNDTVVNPIYEWSDTDVWDYLKENHYPYNPMYDKGYHRVGCIGCPMATYKQKMKEFADFPYAKDMYIKAFDKMLDRMRAEGKTIRGEWHTGLDVYKWWIEENKNVTPGQMTLADLETDADGFIIRKPSETAQSKSK
jgi:phosphoadenosine phosphosulfate reductase